MADTAKTTLLESMAPRRRRRPPELLAEIEDRNGSELQRAGLGRWELAWAAAVPGGIDMAMARGGRGAEYRGCERAAVPVRGRVRGSWLRADRPDADVWLSPMGSGGTGAVGAPVGRVRRDASDGAVVTCVDRRRPLR